MHVQIYKEDDTVDINLMGTVQKGMLPKGCHGTTEESAASCSVL